MWWPVRSYGLHLSIVNSYWIFVPTFCKLYNEINVVRYRRLRPVSLLASVIPTLYPSTHTIAWSPLFTIYASPQSYHRFFFFAFLTLYLLLHTRAVFFQDFLFPFYRYANRKYFLARIMEYANREIAIFNAMFTKLRFLFLK